ncbi:hypothetical protein ACFVIY_28895 [Streptomyces sp. NPDC127166]|uniref:hypothetical protein n=1 Tax=Streptomyces sp. NPDC127166 TaxID=3345380 RepID=UPI00362FB985
MTTEALIGLLGVLGGASIAALGAGFVQRSTRRAGERKTAADRAAQSKALGLETAASARAAARSWELYMELVVQDLAARRAVEPGTYDAAIRELLGHVTDALYRLAANESIYTTDRGSRSWAARAGLTEVSTRIRGVLLQQHDGAVPAQEPGVLLDVVKEAASRMNSHLVGESEGLLGKSMPPYLQAQPAPSMPERASDAPAPLPFEPFWFGVPAPRALQGEDGRLIPLTILDPGIWYLAVGDDGDALVVQTQGGVRGLLRNTNGIQRA